MGVDDPLRPSGGAGGVGDEGWPIRVAEVVLGPLTASYPAVDVLGGDDRDPLRHSEIEVGVEGDRPGAAVVEQPGGLVGGQLGTRRHSDETGRDRPEEDEGEVRPVAHAQQHPVARLQPQPEQPGRDGPDDVVDLGEGPARVVTRPVDDDEGVPVGGVRSGVTDAVGRHAEGGRHCLARLGRTGQRSPPVTRCGRRRRPALRRESPNPRGPRRRSSCTAGRRGRGCRRSSATARRPCTPQQPRTSGRPRRPRR